MEIKQGDKILLGGKIWFVTSTNIDGYGDAEIWIENSEGEKDYFGGGAHQFYWIARVQYLEIIIEGAINNLGYTTEKDRELVSSLKGAIGYAD